MENQQSENVQEGKSLQISPEYQNYLDLIIFTHIKGIKEIIDNYANGDIEEYPEGTNEEILLDSIQTHNDIYAARRIFTSLINPQKRDYTNDVIVSHIESLKEALKTVLDAEQTKQIESNIKAWLKMLYIVKFLANGVDLVLENYKDLVESLEKGE